MTSTENAHKADLTALALPPGTLLSGDQFTVTDLLGAGGFGITYRATDNVLGRTIVIKECFPADFCVRDGNSVVARTETYVKPIRSIVEMFMREARSLAKLRHPNVVGVHRAFEENNTAYMVLDLIDGQDLFDIIQSDAPQLSPRRVQDILLQLLDAIEKVHEVDLLHRDISPDNIIIEKNGTPVLIDFGAARGDASRHTRAVSALLTVKDGYSPQEFYVAGSQQTPSSDLYALAATFYHVLSGEPPVNSQARTIEIVGQKPDPCIPLAGRIEGYSPEFLQAIDTAMRIHPGDRLQSAAKWKSLIADHTTETSPQLHGASIPRQDFSLELERSLTKLVMETNDEVRRTSETPVEAQETVVPPEKPAKPEWIEEFNQESREPVELPSVWDDEPIVLPETAPLIAEVQGDQTVQAAEYGPKPTQGEISWIDRALEKQERIRSERERALDLFDDEAEGRAKVSLKTNSAEAVGEISDPEAPEIRQKRKFRPIGVLAGLLAGLFCMFFLEGP